MSDTESINENPFHFRLVLVCSNSHETEVFSGTVDPKNPPNVAMLEALPPMGSVQVCECGADACILRPYWNGEPMEEVPSDMFRISLEKSGNNPAKTGKKR